MTKRTVLRAGAGLLAFVAGLSVVPFLLMTEDQPAVRREVALAPDHVERVKAIVDRHRYRVAKGSVGAITVRADDADALANYLAHRFYRGSASVRFDDGSAEVGASLPLWGGRRYLNVVFTLVDTGGLPDVRQVAVGRVSVPDWLTARLLPGAFGYLRRTPEIRAGLDALRTVRILHEAAHVTYRWDGVPEDVRAQMVDATDRERLRRAQDHLRSILLAARAGPQATLPEILVPLLQHAARQAGDGDPVAENRAAILVAMFHVLRKNLKLVVPEAVHWPRPPRQVVMLDGRHDLAQHFIVSAAIAAYADTTLADAVGLYKEVEDSRGGSGFSFDDLAADRAGTRFGELAAAPDSARTVQARVAAGLGESDVMPPWRDLPSSLPEAEFTARFGGVGGAGYRELMAEIERRVAALPVLR